jgi:hypothetical protein
MVEDLSKHLGLIAQVPFEQMIPSKMIPWSRNFSDPGLARKVIG